MFILFGITCKNKIVNNICINYNSLIKMENILWSASKNRNKSVCYRLELIQKHF